MLLSTKFSPRNYNTAIFARIAYHMYVNRISALFLWLIFMSLNFAYFPKDTAASVATDKLGQVYYFQKRGDLCFRYGSLWQLLLEATTSNNESTTLCDKGCTHSSKCSDDNAWYGCVALAFLIDVKKCELYYRNGDFCNEGKVPMVSGIMLLACALVAFPR